MNLRKMIFWNASKADVPDATSPATTSDVLNPSPSQALPAAGSNVISLPSASHLDMPAGLNVDLVSSAASANAMPPPARGLMDAPELKRFFADNHFGLGRHNGSNYKTQESLVLGKQALVSKFQNTLADLVEKRQSKLENLRDKSLQTAGFCEVTTGRLQQAQVRLEREMMMLRDQFDKSSDGKGWVLEALNQYQIGFGKGLREAIEFELMAE